MASADQLGFSFRPAERRTWTVRDLVAAVRTNLEREYGDVWVEGEISNFRAHDSGHLYFTLKDRNAQIRVVMFRSSARLLRFRPEDGLQVVVRGRVTIYEDRGELQISAEYVEPKGAGALQIAFDQLKAKLEAEGLFDSARKKPIPALPASSPAMICAVLEVTARMLAPTPPEGPYLVFQPRRGRRSFSRVGVAVFGCQSPRGAGQTLARAR